MMDSQDHQFKSIASVPPSTNEERTWAMGTHISAPLLGLILGGLGVPLGGLVGPLTSWLMKKDQSPFINAHAKEALNANISYLIYGIPIGAILFLMALTVILLIVVIPVAIGIAILYIVWTIKAAIAANKGEFYEYPFNLRLIK